MSSSRTCRRPVRAPIVDIAAALCGTDSAAVLGERRFAPLVRARALVVWALRTIPPRPYSYPAIARVLGGIHHTSAMHLHAKAVMLRLRDRDFAAICRALLAQFGLREEDIHAGA